VKQCVIVSNLFLRAKKSGENTGKEGGKSLKMCIQSLDWLIDNQVIIKIKTFIVFIISG
jgi:hypothetical protein